MDAQRHLNLRSDSLFSVAGCASLQLGHKRRTNRCANTPNRLDDNKKGSTPISRRRVTAPTAVLVCNVDNTK